MAVCRDETLAQKNEKLLVCHTESTEPGVEHLDFFVFGVDVFIRRSNTIIPGLYLFGYQ
jgi:hypothetical protein